MAMVLAIRAGLDSGRDCRGKNTVPYVRILRSSLDIAREFYTLRSSGSESNAFQRMLTVNVMEFHIHVSRNIVYFLFYPWIF